MFNSDLLMANELNSSQMVETSMVIELKNSLKCMHVIVMPEPEWHRHYFPQIWESIAILFLILRI